MATAEKAMKDVERLQERTATRIGASSVDEETRTIRGVALLGKTSRNKRTYSRQALEDVAALARGGKVFLDHVAPGRHRSVKELVGTLRNVHVAGDRVHGDLVVANDEHWPLLAGLAERAPHLAGFSIDGSGKVSRNGGTTVVETVNALKSIDLVLDPATLVSLFESADGDDRDEACTECARLRAENTRLSERVGKLETVLRRTYVRRVLEAAGLPADGDLVESLQDKPIQEIRAAVAVLRRAANRPRSRARNDRASRAPDELCKRLKEHLNASAAARVGR